jgi:sulfhydrogenase subunit gamma (sulfur reductase)
MTISPQRMKIAKIQHQMIDEIRNFRLEPVSPSGSAGFTFIPGQFVQILQHRKTVANFAIASAPEDRTYLDLLIKKHRGVAGTLFEKQVGDEVEITGPHGKGFPIDEHKGKNLLLVGVGTGIAPLRSVLRSALNRREDFGELTLVYGVLTPKHLCYPTDLEEWGRHCSIALYLTVTFPENNSWAGHKGFVQDVLKNISPHPENTVALLVGMNEMIMQNTALLMEMGFSKEDILLNF